MNDVAAAPNWLFVVNVCGWVITFLMGLVVTLLKMESARSERRVDKLEQDYRELNNMVRTDYINREEVNGLVRDVRDQLKLLNGKLDAILLEGRRL
jgi:hypothetical protein